MEIESTSTSKKCSEVLKELRAKSQTEGLSKFLQQELSGYGDCYPEYRLVPVTYFDIGGQIVANIAPEYCNYPLTYGVNCLESHLKNGLALKLPSEVLSFLSDASQNAIAGAHISSQELQKLLTRISEEVKLKFQAEMDN
jgi:hypothetical protein